MKVTTTLWQLTTLQDQCNALVKVFDLDGDGKMDVHEFTEAMEEMFGEYDLDGKLVLDKEASAQENWPATTRTKAPALDLAKESPGTYDQSRRSSALSDVSLTTHAHRPQSGVSASDEHESGVSQVDPINRRPSDTSVAAQGSRRQSGISVSQDPALAMVSTVKIGADYTESNTEDNVAGPADVQEPEHMEVLLQTPLVEGFTQPTPPTGPRPMTAGSRSTTAPSQALCSPSQPTEPECGCLDTMRNI